MVWGADARGWVGGGGGRGSGGGGGDVWGRGFQSFTSQSETDAYAYIRRHQAFALSHVLVHFST